MRISSVILFCAVTTAVAARPVAQSDALHVTVLDPTGAPQAGALVEIRRFQGKDAGYNNLDLRDTVESRPVFRLPTARAGTTAVHVPIAIPHRLRVDVPPFAIEDRRWLYAGEEVVVRLREGATVTGVVKRDDGELIADARVELRHRDGASRIYRRTDEQGRFRFERVRPGASTLEVDTPRGAVPRWEDIAPASGETTEIEIVVAKGAELIGHVLDAATGKPIADAEVGVGWTFDKFVKAAADGSYSLQGLGGPYSNSIYARAPNHGLAELERPQEIDGQVTRDFKLQRGFTLRGRILDVDGKPVEDCYVGAIGQGTDWRSVRTDADGRYQIDGVIAGSDTVLFVRHELRASMILALPGFVPGKPAVMTDITLRPRRIVRGTVISGGQPIVGVKVEIVGCNADAPARRERNLTVRTMVTDSKGRFFFGHLVSGSYSLEVDGHTVEVEVEPDVDPEPIRLER